MSGMCVWCVVCVVWFMTSVVCTMCACAARKCDTSPNQSRTGVFLHHSLFRSFEKVSLNQALTVLPKTAVCQALGIHLFSLTTHAPNAGITGLGSQARNFR